MKEYIEREALKERFQKRLIWLKKDIHDEYSKGLFHGCETDMGLIDEIPTADVSPVRHGRWMDAESDDGCIVWYCSVCSYPVKTIGGYPIYKYCPMCSARMDKEGEHETD